MARGPKPTAGWEVDWPFLQGESGKAPQGLEALESCGPLPKECLSICLEGSLCTQGNGEVETRHHMASAVPRTLL